MKNLFLALCFCLIAASASAQGWIFVPTPSAAGCTPLGASVASTVLDLSSGCADSYSGSGSSWANIEDSPADSAAQSAYNMTLSGMTFNGSAGVPGAYFSTDGNDYVDIASGTNTTFLHSLHKTTAGVWWAAAVIKLPASVDDTQHALFLTAPTGNDTGLIVLFYSNSAGADGQFVIRQQKGGSSANKISSQMLPQGGSYLLVMSHDQATNNTRLWINGAEAGGGTHTYVSSTTADSTYPLRLFRDDAGNNFWPAQATTRLYEFSMGNAYLDDAGEALIRAEYETRTGLDLTN